MIQNVTGVASVGVGASRLLLLTEWQDRIYIARLKENTVELHVIDQLGDQVSKGGHWSIPKII